MFTVSLNATTFLLHQRNKAMAECFMRLSSITYCLNIEITDRLAMRFVNTAPIIRGSVALTGWARTRMLAHSQIKQDHDMLNTKRMRFPIEVILVCIHWYAAYPLSYCHLEEMMQERGVQVDHSSISRWAIRFLPLLQKVFRKHKRSGSVCLNSKPRFPVDSGRLMAQLRPLGRVPENRWSASAQPRA